MSSLTGFKGCFRPRWQMSVLALMSILLLTRLGFWQLQRADEKKKMLGSYQTYSQQAPSQWPNGHQLPKQYQQIRVHGHFLREVVLLDNQHYQHQFGYRVLSPFSLDNGRIVFVDRGGCRGM